MKEHGYYKGREQTYLKHFILEKYLESVAYKILSFENDFVYVDGFSGPWKSDDEKYEDTSFVIAINQLRKVREGVQNIGKNPRFRCLFIENDIDAYKELERVVKSITDIEIKPIYGSFEESVNSICQFIGRSFSLVFIDPTGWTGFGLNKIQPILRLRGEVLINFMFDYINRFIDDPRPEIISSFVPLFGGAIWMEEIEMEMKNGLSREEAILAVYQNRARNVGQYPYITSTRIMKPLVDRSYFYLIYGTRSWNGIQTFREIEKKFVLEQEHLRTIAKIDKRTERTGQVDLFHPSNFSQPLQPDEAFEYERERRVHLAKSDLLSFLKNKGKVKYKDIVGEILQRPLVWESDLKTIISDLRKKGSICIPDWKERQRVPKPENIIFIK